MLASLPGSGKFLSESCLEVPGPILSSQFISHNRGLDSQFLLQMDLSLGSKLLVRGGLVLLARKEGDRGGHLRVRCFFTPASSCPEDRHVGASQVLSCICMCHNVAQKSGPSLENEDVSLVFRRTLGYDHFTSHERENSKWVRVY